MDTVHKPCNSECVYTILLLPIQICHIKGRTGMLKGAEKLSGHSDWATNWRSGVRSQRGVTDISILHSFQTGSEVQSVSYPLRTEDFIPKGKATEEWKRPSQFIQCQG
jgi:hypothetical protein